MFWTDSPSGINSTSETKFFYPEAAPPRGTSCTPQTGVEEIHLTDYPVRCICARKWGADALSRATGEVGLARRMERGTAAMRRHQPVGGWPRQLWWRIALSEKGDREPRLTSSIGRFGRGTLADTKTGAGSEELFSPDVVVCQKEQQQKKNGSHGVANKR